MSSRKHQQPKAGRARIRSTSGMSIMEVVIAAGIMGVVTMGVLSLSTLTLKQQTQSNVTFHADTTRRTLLAALNNRASWERTVTNPVNHGTEEGMSALDCIPVVNPPPGLNQAGFACEAAGGAPFSNKMIRQVNNAAGGLVYDASTPTKGIGQSGAACDGFVDPTSGAAGNDQCPLRFEVRWTAICSNNPCVNPQVQLRIVALYNPGPNRITFNPANYGVEAALQGQLGSSGTCWTHTGDDLTQSCGTRVGIGTSTPNALTDLHVMRSGGMPRFSIHNPEEQRVFFELAGTGGVGGNEGFELEYDNAGNTIFKNRWYNPSNGTGSMFFRTNSSQPMGGVVNNLFTLHGNGNVGVGTTTPSSRLQVETNTNPGAAVNANSENAWTLSVRNVATSASLGVYAESHTTPLQAYNPTSGAYGLIGNSSVGVMGYSPTGRSNWGGLFYGDYGVHGQSLIANGYGAYGVNNVTRAHGLLGYNVHGAYGYSYSGSGGWGGLFQGDYGVYGQAWLPGGYAVYGHNNATQAHGLLGYNVHGAYGYSYAGRSGWGGLFYGDYGAYGSAWNPNGYGV